MTVQQLIRELKKDATTYRRSGGGITLSGGEPLVQHEFASELLRACKAQGWDTAIETTGAGLSEAVEQVIPYVDTVLLDIKHLDTGKHKQFTGIGNEQILKNAARISQISNTVVRVPVIPGFNYSEQEIRAIAEFAKIAAGSEDDSLLPYHTFGENKYDLLGRDYELADIKPLKPEELEPFKAMVEKEGFQCIIGRFKNRLMEESEWISS